MKGVDVEAMTQDMEVAVSDEVIPAWERASADGTSEIKKGLALAMSALERVIGWAGTLGEDTERLEAVKLSLEVLLRERQ